MEENKRIIVVDDDPGVLEAYLNILAPPPQDLTINKGLELFGPLTDDYPAVNRIRYEVNNLTRGEAGIEAVKESVAQGCPVAVVFLDMNMPGIDGAETAQKMWQIDPRLKIVIVTAFSSRYNPEDIVEVTNREDLFFLRKPFTHEEIRQFARALTKQWSLERWQEKLSADLDKANADLEQINLNLQDRVKKQAQLLMQTEKMAAVGLLAAGVAHEINNPISFVHSNLSSLKKYHARLIELFRKYQELQSFITGTSSNGIKQLLKDIDKFQADKKINYILTDMVALTSESLEGTSRVRKIVNDLRTFARFDSDDFVLANLNEIMESTLNIIWNELKYKAIIVKDYGEIPKVHCNCQKISQVFLNLLLNAVQAVDTVGTIKISSRCHSQDHKPCPGWVEVIIADDGHGIPAENITKLFDPFFTTKPVGQGTGLGLSIAYDIIQAHYGRIEVKSEVGVGTIFTVKIPLPGEALESGNYEN